MLSYCYIVITNISSILSGMSTQPNKGKTAWEGADEEERESPGVWEEAVDRVKENERRKKQEEKEAEEDRLFWEEQNKRLRERKRREEEAKERERLAKIEKEKQRIRDIEKYYKRKHENERMLDKIAKEAEVIREERAKEEAMKKRREGFDKELVQLARAWRDNEEVMAEARKKMAKGEPAFFTQYERSP